MIYTEDAPAKINLFLHVGRATANGRHPLCSLVVFADVGDIVRAEASSAAELVVTGPFADQIGPEADNLVTRALSLAEAEPMRVSLEKALPAAAGLGGGTSDAGAALRLAGRLFSSISSDRLEAAALALGADGLMCLRAEPCLAEGEGEQLSPAPKMPPLPVVLMNPGVPSPTGAVYRAYDEGDGRFLADRPEMPMSFETPQAVAAFLGSQRNDLEAPAARLVPEIPSALSSLGAQDDALLCRMSGSGATVFGLFATPSQADAAATRLRTAHPGWWIRSGLLNAPAKMRR